MWQAERLLSIDSTYSRKEHVVSTQSDVLHVLADGKRHYHRDTLGSGTSQDVRKHVPPRKVMAATACQR